MNKLFGLHAAKVIIDRNKMNNAREFATLLRQLRCQKRRLIALLRYKRQCQTMLTELGKQGIRAAYMQQHHYFLAQLDRAIEQQKKVVENYNVLCERKRKQWVSHVTKSRDLRHAQIREREKSNKNKQKQ